MTRSVPPELVVLATEHWVVNHRIDSRVPGYLIVGAADANACQLWRVAGDGLAELGGILADCSRALTETCGASRVYVGRYGHDSGWPVHFHVVPVYGWVEAAYAARHPDEEPADGVDLTRFVMREFCERSELAAGDGPGVADVVVRLREALRR